jgi:superfamily II DNA or RNA helicase
MDNKNQYVDLTVNGRLFPTWIMANYKKFKLPTLVLGADDACLRKTTGDLRQYQAFLIQYLDYRSPFKDILIYHGLGTGKTSTAINIYNALYNYNPGWNVFIIIKAALHKSTWTPELQKWLSKDDKDYRMKNIIFIHYDSPFADREFFEAVRMSDTSKKNMYIIDECHNFISNVYGNISTNKGKRAQSIYDYIVQDKRDNDSSRVILLSGTPAINSPFELALLFNLLRPGTFPKSESQFNQLFVSQTLHGEMNSAMKNLFQRRILGLVSYYIGATPDYFAKEIPHYVDVKMSEYQKDIYKFYADIEAKAMLKSKGKQETYRTYTRQACNFVFPHISQHITGEQRPRPGAFRMSEREAEKIDHGKLKVDVTGKFMDVQGYKDEVAKYLKAFEEFMDGINEEDIKKKHTLNDDIETYRTKYKNNYEEFFEKEKNKSGLFTKLFESSAKAMYMIFTILQSRGPVLIYTNYVLMEGIQLMKIYLKYFGFSLWGKSGQSAGKDGYRYAEYHGNVDVELRDVYKSVFNDKKNSTGQLIKIIMISPAGVEGISLSNVRQIHLFEPYWHEVRMKQMIGRGIRLLSHCDIPMEDRFVDVYRYKAVIDEKTETSDQYIENTARNKDRLITSFLDAVKESAVDCQLFYEHNVLKQDLKCFMFDEPSILSKQIGPAYKKDILDDITMNTGSNSTTSVTRKVKVTKISAVQKLSKDGEEQKYSKPEKYWCSIESGTVYELDMHYAIGKINRDENGILSKLDKDTYIIDMVVPIPMIKKQRD